MTDLRLCVIIKPWLIVYSVDFRKRAIGYWDKGHTQEELYEAFGIYTARVNEWKRLLKKTGSLEQQYPETRKGKIDPQKLKQELERKPDLTLSELGKIFGCTK